MLRPSEDMNDGALRFRDPTSVESISEASTEIADAGLQRIPELGKEPLSIQPIVTDEGKLEVSLSDEAQALRERYEQLTQREQAIAALLVQGRAEKSIADGLYLSVRTVASHRNNIHAKLGVSNQLMLLRFLITAELIKQQTGGNDLQRRLNTLATRERETLLCSFRYKRVPDAASALQMSYRTAKTHLQAVYRKLEVSGRTAALYQLYTAGLIDQELHWTTVGQP